MWNKLQAEVSEWSKKNFGERTALQPFVGLIEEMAEFCNAVDSHNQKEVEDALGDFFIFLADFVDARGLDMNHICCGHLWSTLPYISKEKHYLEIFRSLGEAAHCALKLEQGIRTDEDHSSKLEIHLRNAVIALCRLVRTNSDDILVECVMPIWGNVKKRDWKRNEINGIVPKTA